MLFNSYIFIFFFFPVVLLGYYGLNHMKLYKPAMLFMVGMSLWFCGYQNAYYLIVLMISVGTNYLILCLMKRAKAEEVIGRIHIRKIYLWTGILLNIGILFIFKYYDFFVENLNAAFKTNMPLLDLLLPLGISFYTFGQLSFLVDAYGHECDDYSMLEYAAYVLFFPKFMQGPIAYHSEIITQFRDEQKKKINFENLSRGLYAFALGLAKKVLIADTLAKLVNVGYGDIAGLNTSGAIFIMVSYSLQIYFDFSGYCDMAYGIGYMLNIELPINFNSPYKAVSISDFWDRWHMTLTRFFTRYIYIPLGGSRKGRIRTYVNVLIVFLISGLWHGANWTFIVWGLFNGLIIVIEKLLKVSNWKLPKGLRVGVTFILTTFAWSVFRAPTLADAGLMWNRLLHGGIGPVAQVIIDTFQELVEISVLYRPGVWYMTDSHPGLLPVLFIVSLVVACFTMKNTQEKMLQLKFTTGKFIVVVVLMLWSIVSLSEISQFLYSNF